MGAGNPNWRDPVTGKGISGNPHGRPPAGESLTELLAEFGEKMREDPRNKKSKTTYKRLLAERIWHFAINKADPASIKHIFDRIEGPVANINYNYNQEMDERLETLKQFIRDDLLRCKQYVHEWYKPAFYHREISAAICDEKVKRLIVTLPPQFGKTEVLCKTFPAWFLANNPEKSIIVGAYNQEYANKISVQCRDFFNSPKFLDLYNGSVKLHPDQQTKHEWMLADHKGSAIYSGVGGTVTGNPADVFLIDDVVKDFEDACSKVMQERIWNWYNSVVQSRLQGESSRIIIVMTRWTKNDLIGRILDTEEKNQVAVENRFKVLHYPAILDVPASGDYSAGRSLWPEKKSMKFLLERQQSEPAVFKALWQGNPRDMEGLVIKPEWIRLENDPKSLGQLIGSCRGWDFGYTVNGDETVGARIDAYQDGEKITCVLSSVVRCRKDPAGVKELVVKTSLEDGPGVTVAVEGGGTQIAMASAIAQRKELADYQVRSVVPKGDKISRAMPWILKLEDNMLRLATAPWNAEIIRSLIDFEEGCDHDDIEDAITTAWKILWGEKA